MLLDGKQPDLARQKYVVNTLAGALQNGYTYQAVRKEIMNAFMERRQFNPGVFAKKVDDNILQQGKRYYHMQLVITPPIQPTYYDAVTGQTSSAPSQFWLEPRASYTYDEMVEYFYYRTHADKVRWYPKRVKGILKSFVQRYGLDKVLLMIEHAGRMWVSDRVAFDLRTFDNYSPVADEYFCTLKDNNVRTIGSTKYVLRKRVLFV